jgi:hypothetical protein
MSWALIDQSGEFVLAEPERNLGVADRVGGRVGALLVEVGVELGQQGGLVQPGETAP